MISTFYHIRCLYILLILLSLAGCSREDEFLSAKPNQSLAVPQTLDDLEALLKKEDLFNNNEPIIGTLTADDDYYVTSDTWNQSLYFITERNAYIWAGDIYENELTDISSWTSEYEKVYVANVVLDGLKDIDNGQDQSRYGAVKGTALFFRALAFYNLVQNFSVPYDESTADKDAGIPLRLSSDLNISPGRATAGQTYRQIFADLEEALALVPATVSSITRPSRAAVLALLARVSLATRNYSKAMDWSDQCIREKPALTDFNRLTPKATSIHNALLEEDLFHTLMRSTVIANRRYTIINADLYASYQANDLRKTLYFVQLDGQTRFRGTYDFRGGKFSGLAADEVYLTRAECYARQGNTALAIADLNTLLSKRWKTGTFVPYQDKSKEEALALVMQERRKELIFRGIRPADIKRFNKEGQAITLKRTINGIEHVLPPNDPRYAFPIPKIEIELSGIPQNQR